MSRIGLVLGGGGITGAAFQVGALMALELACDWDANQAEVVVGTSGGSYVASLVRSSRLDLDCLVREHESPAEVADRIRSHIFSAEPQMEVARWLRHGLLPGLKSPGFTFLLGSPARFGPSGLVEWVHQQSGPTATGWPERPTVVVAYDIEARTRVAFGTPGAPQVPLADAVAASSAIPVLFHPHSIDGRSYVDGGVASGTHLDLVVGERPPLDLVIVVAPMASIDRRRGGWAPERFFDRLGRRALEREIDIVSGVWPSTEILVLRPPARVLSQMRPNPMAADRAVSTFVMTLAAMNRHLAQPEVWEVLRRHLLAPGIETAV